jgi:hypothetical protein
MLRVTCVATALIAAAAMSLPAQSRNNDFGRPDWCDDSFSRDRRATECRVVDETVSDARELDVNAGQNGGIRVRGWDRAEAEVRVKITAWARTSDRARQIVDSVRLETGGGRIRATSPSEDWAASFELQVPRNARLTLNAHNGGLTLEDFDGIAEMRTQNGGVSVVNIGGDIVGRTQNGGINASLSGAQWNGRGLDLETHNGGVSMTLPENYSAELETGTVNGGLRIDFPITLQGTLNRRRITTTIGSGGPRIRAVTTNGGVRIRRD